MDIEKNLMYILNAFQRIKEYACAIYDSADEDVRGVILAICDQEIKSIEYDLEQYKLKEFTDNDNNQRKE